VPHPFFVAGRPLIFAHRGGASLAPENTMEAFANGLAFGADGIELDVRLAKDGIVVVHHDATLDRTTNATGPVDAKTAKDLASVDAGYRMVCDGAYAFRNRGIGVPALADVLATFRDARVIIELKGNTRELAAAVVSVIRQADAMDRVCLGSFGTQVLRAVRKLEPAAATSASREEVRWALYKSWCGWPSTRARYGGFQVPEYAGTTRVVSPRFIELSHRAALAVQVWTVDSIDDARRLLGWGADALITDRPDTIVPLLRQLQTAR
jgi:glycerophosphoryl diester phosphodiesterase